VGGGFAQWGKDGQYNRYGSSSRVAKGGGEVNRRGVVKNRGSGKGAAGRKVRQKKSYLPPFPYYKLLMMP